MIEDELRQTFRKYSRQVVGIEVQDQAGNLGIGTAFHIGDGFLITAAHVLENQEIVSIIAEPGVTLSVVHSVTTAVDDDLALLSTNYSFAGENVEGIQLGGHLDDWIDDSFDLQTTLLMGYPRIPMTRSSMLVASKGEVNAIVDRFDRRGAHFILSSTARGGFSGGPVLWGGALLGVITSSLYRQEAAFEPGYAAAVSIEVVFDLLENSAVSPRINRTQCYLLGLEPFRAAIESTVGEEERQLLREWSDDPVGSPEPSTSELRPAVPLISGKPVWSAPAESPRLPFASTQGDGPFE